MILERKIETATSTGIVSKGWYRGNNGKLYLVKGNSARGTYEPQSEVLVSNLLDLIGVRHVRYKLANGSMFKEIKTFGNNYVSICEAYDINESIESLSFLNFLAMWAEGNGQRLNEHTIFNVVLQLPEHLKNQIFIMLRIDAIVGNHGRHLNNWDILRLEAGGFEVAPLFDFGASMLALVKYDKLPTRDRLGSDKSKPFKDTHFKQIKLINKYDSNYIPYDQNLIERWVEMSSNALDTLPDARKKAVVNYVNYRYKYYTNLRELK